MDNLLAEAYLSTIFPEETHRSLLKKAKRAKARSKQCAQNHKEAYDYYQDCLLAAQAEAARLWPTEGKLKRLKAAALVASAEEVRLYKEYLEAEKDERAAWFNYRHSSASTNASLCV